MVIAMAVEGARGSRRRMLLAVKALSCSTLRVSCKQPEVLGNPKPSRYEEEPGAGGSATTDTPDAGTVDGGVTPETSAPQPQPDPPPLPANPKGSWYDHGGYEDESKG